MINVSQAILVSVSDDNEKSVRRRLEAYENETAPLITYYRAQHKLRTVLADAPALEIFRFLCEVVDVEIRPLEKKVIPDELHRKKRSGVVAQIRGGSITAGQALSQVTGVSPREDVQCVGGDDSTAEESSQGWQCQEAAGEKTARKENCG